MNNDEQYIKMVLALDPKFFENWEWEAGDRAITEFNREIMIIDSQDRQKLYDPARIEAVYPYSVYNEYDVFLKKDLRPIPSQNQLQDIIMKKMNWSPNTLLEMFMFWAQTGIQRDDFWQFDSWDEGWLQFYMFVIEGKSWNGDNWI